MPRAIRPATYAWLLVSVVAAVAGAASPSAEQALKLLPVQQGVDFDRPADQQIAECKITAKRFEGYVGWVVESPQGLLLRKFVDTNGDNVVDQWSYYQDGMEVYRDIDADFDGKADQYRWFHTAGSRWGLDPNEDGRIDQWKAISAEEASAEAVAALAARDADRFARLLLTADESASLGLGKAKADELAEKLGKLAADFKALIARPQGVAPDMRWIQFSATRPGVVPVGTDGSTKDVRAYENVMAIVQIGEKHGQVQIGTLVQVGDLWRLIDLPQPIAEGQAELPPTGFFFQTAAARRGESGAPATSDQAQLLLSELEKLDKAAAAAAPEAQAALTARRAQLIEQIAQQAGNPEDRAMWLRQLADMISAAVQSGTCPDGPERLRSLFEKLQASPADKDLAAYVKFRQLTAEYGLSLQAPKADFAKIQTEWLKNLEAYVQQYPTSPDAAEAMLQLAIAQEFAGQEDEAKKWYGRIVQGFANSPAAGKAAGARIRLDSVGKVLAFSGRSTAGGAIDLAQYRGKVVLIQYWATWCGPCKADMATLKELVAKHGKSFAVIGVSLDDEPKNLGDFLAQNRLPWPQIFEEGGLDSRPANALGILTLPTMILVDPQGRVVDRNIQAAELEAALQKLIR